MKEFATDYDKEVQPLETLDVPNDCIIPDGRSGNGHYFFEALKYNCGVYGGIDVYTNNENFRIKGPFYLSVAEVHRRFDTSPKLELHLNFINERRIRAFHLGDDTIRIVLYRGTI